MSNPYAKPSLKAVAHHEAAHAVAHLKLGLPGQLEYIEADDQEPRGGHTEINRPDETPPSSNQAVDCIVQNLVGAAAATKIDADCGIAKSGAEDDYCKAKGYVSYFNVAEDWSTWEEKAFTFVDEYWQQIQAVATKLLAQPTDNYKKRLDGGRVRDLVCRS